MFVVLALAGLWFLLPAASVQGAEKPIAKADAAKKELDLRPVELGGNDLVTDDGVLLAATFYPSPKGREAIPVILLHSYKGNRKEFSALAGYLQQQGHAVLVPDLRGHGDSTGTRAGVKLDAARMPTQQFEQMYYEDIKALRRFLVAKNDADELNLSKLCLIGADMGATVALRAAWLDWTPVPGRPTLMDVKALVLLSPPASFRGLDVRTPLANPAVRSQLSVLILVGKLRKRDLDDAERLYNMFKPYHPDPPKEELAEKQDLFFLKLDTELQGAKMLGKPGLRPDPKVMIAQFIELRLVKQDREGYGHRKRRD